MAHERSDKLKLIAISEHFYPRVGGTVNYVHETLCALVSQGVEVELLVPGPEPALWLPEGVDMPLYTISWLDVGYPAKGDPTRQQRYAYCEKVNCVIDERSKLDKRYRPDVVHVLFGLFVMEVLNTNLLQDNGVHCVATVHNVPPMECRQITHNASTLAYFKERVRLLAVSVKNKARLRKHNYDHYIVPSEQVYKLLAPLVKSKVGVIGHGVTHDLHLLMNRPVTRRPKDQVRLLTTGGYIPHKRQHIIPAVAELLREAGIDFIWEVVGPATRINGYFDSIKTDVERRNLGSRVCLHQAVSFIDLADMYDRAHIYVQPSIEEGFCITALDAAAAGLPVIASPAGALEQIANVSGGMSVQSEPELLSKAIIEFVHGDCWGDSEEIAKNVRTQFSWDTAATALCARYDELLKAEENSHE